MKGRSGKAKGRSGTAACSAGVCDDLTSGALLYHYRLSRLSCYMFRGGILGVRCGYILMISFSNLPELGRVSAKSVNELTDFNAAVSSPVQGGWGG